MKRGDVVLVRLPRVDPASPTHLRRGLRPAAIVQSDAPANPAAVVQVVPATSNQRTMRYSCSLLVQPDSMNGLNLPSVLMATRLGAVDAARIESRLGTLSAADLQALERCIEMLPGLRQQTALAGDRGLVERAGQGFDLHDHPLPSGCAFSLRIDEGREGGHGAPGTPEPRTSRAARGLRAPGPPGTPEPPRRGTTVREDKEFR